MELLGIDYGDKRVGIARIDSDVLISQPLKTLENNESLLEQIAAIIKEYESEVVVVGLPLNLSGEPTQQTEKTEVFFEALQAYLEIDVVFFEESGTSKMADERLRNGWGGKTADRDSVAAAIILEGFMREGGLR